MEKIDINKLLVNKKILVTILFLTIVFFGNAQIKKAYKDIEKKRFYTALTTFCADENLNSAVAKFGIAIIFNSSDFEWVDYRFKNKNRYLFYKTYKTPSYNRYEFLYKLTSYKNTLYAAENFLKTDGKLQKTLKKYISAEIIDVHKNSLEKYFLNMENKEFLKIYDSLNIIKLHKDFKQKIENKYVEVKYEEFISAESSYAKGKAFENAEKLLSEYPNTLASEKLQNYVDSMTLDYANNPSRVFKLLRTNPNTKFKSKAYEKIDRLNKKKQASSKGKRIYVVKNAKTKSEALDLFFDLSDKISGLYIYEQSDKELAVSRAEGRFLIYECPFELKEKTILSTLSWWRKKGFEDVFLLDFESGLRVYNKNKLFLKEKSLLEYKAVVLFGKADYFEYEQEIREGLNNIEKKLSSQTDYLIINREFDLSPNPVEIKIPDNPYPQNVSFSKHIPVTKYTDLTIFVGFVQNGKEPMVFEVSNYNNINNILNRAKKYFSE